MNKLRKTIKKKLSFDLSESIKDFVPVLKNIKAQAPEIDLDNDPEFVADFLKSKFVEDIYQAMDKIKIKKNVLAERLNRSPQYVGHVLNENSNFTIETMTNFAFALNMRLQLNLIEMNQQIYSSESIIDTSSLKPVKAHEDEPRDYYCPKPQIEARIKRKKEDYLMRA